jgi:hypothetical protein
MWGRIPGETLGWLPASHFGNNDSVVLLLEGLLRYPFPTFPSTPGCKPKPWLGDDIARRCSPPWRRRFGLWAVRVADGVVTMAVVRFRRGVARSEVSARVKVTLVALPLLCAVFAGGTTPLSLGGEGRAPSSGSSTARWPLSRFFSSH